MSATYPREAQLRIRNKCSQNSGEDDVRFFMTDPCEIQNKKVNLGETLGICSSLCTLPGIDPRGLMYKKCQDACMFLNNTDSAFVALFDGHGPEGEKVVTFCCLFTEKFYKTSFPAVTASEESSGELIRFLTALTETCDSDLLKSKNIDSTFSGCTAVFVLLTSTVVYTASVGDSRAILAQNRASPPLFDCVMRGESLKLLELKSNKLSSAGPSIFPLQLSKDQRPEDPEELERIQLSGGRVKKLVDDEGNRVGPYRVWEFNSKSPGLAMSRSIGDSAAKGIGVISTPLTSTYPLDLEHDLFIVIASDGVWDAMDNESVSCFVEYFRKFSCKTSKKKVKSADITPENATISQLLCEEARSRWKKIIEEEDVMIDDISCVVLELFPTRVDLPNSKNAIASKIRDRSPMTCAHSNSISIKDSKIKDPVRSSFVFSS